MSNVDNKDKILYFFTSCYPYGFGETFIENEIEYLSNGFYKIYIISNDLESNNFRNIPSNVEVIRLRYDINLIEKISSFYYMFTFHFWRELKYIKIRYQKKLSFGIIKTALLSLFNANRLIKKYRDLNIIDSKSFYYSYWSNDCALALAILKHENVDLKCFSRIHGWDVFFSPSKYNYLPFRNFIASNLNSIFSISEKGIDYCLNNWRINNKSVMNLSRLGVNDGFFSKEDSSSFLLVSCSNMIPLKRIDLLINSLSLIQFKLKWVHFGDGEKMDELLLLSNAILKKHIDFEFKGRVENNVVLDFYKNNKPSLFINLSSSEGVPVSIMEAMSYGIPAIATQVGGNSEIVNDENGFLIDADPIPQTVADKIIHYYNSGLEQKNIKRMAAYNTYSDKYNSTKNYTQFVADILSL